MSIYKPNENFLNKELENLYEELKNMDILYDETKKILDDHISPPPGNSVYNKKNYVFIASQNSNLVTIRDKRLSILKEIDNLKLKQEEIRYKQASFNKEDGNIENNEIMKNILNAININNSNTFINDNTKKESINEDDNILLDNEIDNILKEEENDFNFISDYLNDLNKSTDKYEFKLAFDLKDNQVYIIDQDYNLYQEYSNELNRNYFKMDENFIVDSDNEIAFDKFNNEYELIELEEN